ncbi:MAG: tetratricopeptide repeat protein [Bryobacteraceae bacterium]
MLVAFMLLYGFAQDAAEWHARGMAHIAKAEFSQARTCFTKAIELDPQSPALRINLGNVLVKLGADARTTSQIG